MEVVYEQATYIQIAEGDIAELYEELDSLWPDSDDNPRLVQLRIALEHWLETD